MEFEWDERNLRHVLGERPHGVSPALVEEIGRSAPKLFPNAPDPARTRSGSHLMVGPDGSGRFWTVVLLELESERWRPITGWPSTAAEIGLYREEDQ